MSDISNIPRSADEAKRLVALHQYGVLDTPAEDEFDFLAEAAAALCDAPYAFISLVDSDRVWYKSSYGQAVVEAPRDADFCSWTILESTGLSIPDLSADARTANLDLVQGPKRYRMYCGANLTTPDGHNIGSLCVLDTKPRELSPEKFALLTKLARQAMSLIELRAKTRQLKAAYDDLEQLATIDELTGLLNRRALMTKLDVEFERSKRYGANLALVLIDLDHFKQINDRHGHLAGDAALRDVGALLRHRIRATDIAGRYGGEELCLLLPETDMAGASRIANALREMIENIEFLGTRGKLTASFGISVYQTARTDTPERLIEAADRALFRAKHGGRNRVETDDFQDLQ